MTEEPSAATCSPPGSLCLLSRGSRAPCGLSAGPSSASSPRSAHLAERAPAVPPKPSPSLSPLVLLPTLERRSPINSSQMNKPTFGLPRCLSFRPSSRPSLLVQMVKKLPALGETQVGSLGREDPLKKGMVTRFRVLACASPWVEEPDGIQSLGSQRVRQD